MSTKFTVLACCIAGLLITTSSFASTFVCPEPSSFEANSNNDWYFHMDGNECFTENNLPNYTDLPKTFSGAVYNSQLSNGSLTCNYVTQEGQPLPFNTSSTSCAVPPIPSSGCKFANSSTAQCDNSSPHNNARLHVINLGLC